MTHDLLAWVLRNRKMLLYAVLILHIYAVGLKLYQGSYQIVGNIIAIFVLGVWTLYYHD